MSVQEKRKTIKSLFRGYRKMSSAMEIELIAMGFRVEKTKRHIKLYYNTQLFIVPSTASDSRSGMNTASIICRAIQ